MAAKIEGQGRGRGAKAKGGSDNVTPLRPDPALNPDVAPQAKGSVPGDNERAVMEAERDQLISYLGRIQRQKGITEGAKAAYDAERANERQIFQMAKAAGFSRKELEELIAAIASRGRDLVEEEKRRRRLRAYVDLPGGDNQLDLFGETTPEEVKDEALYKSEGYRTGLRGEIGVPPASVPSRFIQAWTAGYHKALDEIGASMKRLAAEGDPAAPAAPPAPEPAAAPAPATDDFEASAEELAAQAPRQALADPPGETI